MSRFTNAKPDLLFSSNQNPVIQEIRLADKSVKYILDYCNDRIKVTSYRDITIIPMVNYMNNLAAQKGFGKIIIVAREENWQIFLNYGYKLEAINTGHYLGYPGFYLAKFFKQERSISTALIDEDNILQAVLKKPVSTPTSPLPVGYVLRDASLEDIEQLSLLFNRVFSSYPTPICEPRYLQQLIQKHPFKVIVHEETIVCASSAETDKKTLSAELTDCACLPEHRSKGLNTHIIYALEQELIQRGYRNLYSIARAKSQGINTVLRKLGYNYGGRFINNCHICGQFEDMNLWHKYTEA